MKVQELLVEEQTLFHYVKALNAEFKELAAQFELTLVAGMGWPQVVKDGAWFGGGLGPKGGFKGEDDKMVSLDIRRRGFLVALAKKLEALAEAGQKIKIAPGAARSVEKFDAEPGNVAEQLKQAAVKNKPPGNVTAPRMPCVSWFVGVPASINTDKLLEVNARAYGSSYSSDIRNKNTNDKGKLINFCVKSAGDTKALKKMEQLIKVIDSKRKKDPNHLYKDIYSPEYRRFMADLITWAQNNELTNTSRGYQNGKDLSHKEVESGSSFWLDARLTRTSSTKIKVIEFEMFEKFLKEHGYL